MLKRSLCNALVTAVLIRQSVIVLAKVIWNIKSKLVLKMIGLLALGLNRHRKMTPDHPILTLTT